MNYLNHSSLIPSTVYCTVHCHYHCIPLLLPSSCAPRTSSLVLWSPPRLSSALYPSALDFLLTHPLPWVPLGAKYLTSPLPFDGPGQVCLIPLVLPAVLSFLQCPPARFNNLLPNPTLDHSLPKPHPYKPDLTPAPFPLHPHCLVHQCLLLWIPSQASPHSTRTDPDGSFPLSDDVLDCILCVIGVLWADSTKELYGTGLLTFHIYCDVHDIPNHHWAPVSSNLLSAFLSSCMGAYSGSTIANYVVVLRAWHILHSLEWNIKDLEYKAILKGVNKLATAGSKCHDKQWSIHW